MSKNDEIKQTIVDSYSNIARTSHCGCSCSCSNQSVQRQTKQIGYSQEEMDKAPLGSNMGLGCGNPVAIASLKKGETVIDLGSGAGFDVFLAARKVGKSGKVIGVDMSNDMLLKATINAENNGFDNVEFKKGDVEKLPIKDRSADVVISNCVINLAPNKEKVFKEMYRVLKPSGRLMVSDTVLLKPLPKKMKNDKDLLVGCVSGAILKNDYLSLLKKCGFKKITINKESPGFLPDFSQSITYSAIK